MRFLALTPILFLAACSEGEAPTKKEAAAPATQLTPGQWEMTTEVVSITQRDKGEPAINTPAGTKTTSSVCVAEADAKKPPADLFAGEGFECTNRDVYMRNGRINATLACSRAGLSGDIATLVNGSYTANTIDATAVTETSLFTEGDVEIQSKIAGKRVGECTAAPAEKAS